MHWQNFWDSQSQSKLQSWYKEDSHLTLSNAEGRDLQISQVIIGFLHPNNK